MTLLSEIYQRENRAEAPVEITVVIPCFNEEDVIPVSLPVIISEVEKTNVEFEILVVNDGSTDKSSEKISAISEKCPRVHEIKLTRNFGHQSAMLAGIEHATGNWIITMDIDLQDPPEIIKDLYETAKNQQVCLVLTRRTSRESDGFFKKSSAKVFYALLRKLNTFSIPNSGDYRLMHKCVLKEIKALGNDHVPLRLYLTWLGIKFQIVSFERGARAAGETKYTLKKMIRLGLESYLAFGTLPLRIIALSGISLGLLSLLVGLFEIFIWLRGAAIPGVTTIVLPLLFTNAVIMFSIGLVGEYLGQALQTIRKRPRYVLHGCNGSQQD